MRLRRIRRATAAICCANTPQFPRGRRATLPRGRHYIRAACGRRGIPAVGVRNAEVARGRMRGHSRRGRTLRGDSARAYAEGEHSRRGRTLRGGCAWACGSGAFPPRAYAARTPSVIHTAASSRWGAGVGANAPLVLSCSPCSANMLRGAFWNWRESAQRRRHEVMT